MVNVGCNQAGKKNINNLDGELFSPIVRSQNLICSKKPSIP